MKKEQRLIVCSYSDHGDYTVRVTKYTAQCLKCQEIRKVPAAPDWPEGGRERLPVVVNGRGRRMTTEDPPTAVPREWWRNVAVPANTMPPEERAALENDEYPDPYDEDIVRLDEPEPGFEPWNGEEDR